MSMKKAFAPLEFRFRGDGFPLCPSCGEDELASDVGLGWLNVERKPSIVEALKGSFFCYRCNWRGANLWPQMPEAEREAIEALELLAAPEPPPPFFTGAGLKQWFDLRSQP